MVAAASINVLDWESAIFDLELPISLLVRLEVHSKAYGKLEFFFVLMCLFNIL